MEENAVLLSLTVADCISDATAKVMALYPVQTRRAREATRDYLKQLPGDFSWGDEPHVARAWFERNE